MSPRPPSKISLRHDWTKELGSKVDRQPQEEVAREPREEVGEVSRQAKFFQPTKTNRSIKATLITNKVFVEEGEKSLFRDHGYSTLYFPAFCLSVPFFNLSDEQQPELYMKDMETLCDSVTKGCEDTYEFFYLHTSYEPKAQTSSKSRVPLFGGCKMLFLGYNFREGGVYFVIHKTFLGIQKLFGEYKKLLGKTKNFWDTHFFGIQKTFFEIRKTFFGIQKCFFSGYNIFLVDQNPRTSHKFLKK